jgi:hypothetical protein
MLMFNKALFFRNLNQNRATNATSSGPCTRTCYESRPSKTAKPQMPSHYSGLGGATEALTW